MVLVSRGGIFRGRSRPVTDPAAYYEEVGRRIRAARKERKLTQEELAGLVSLTRTSITNIEKGRQKLLLHTLADFAHALRVGPADLLPEGVRGPERELEDALKDRPGPERAWIKSAVLGAQGGQADDHP